MHTGKFVTAINCMDGRVQEPVIAWMKNEYTAQFRGPDYRGRSKQSSLSQQRSGRHRLDQKQDRNISEEPWFERHCDCRALRLRRQPERKRDPTERHPRSKRASEVLVSRMHSSGLVGQRSLERYQSRLTEDR